MDFNKISILKGLELYKDFVNELIKRLELINLNSAKSWEINAAREFVNTELFPDIRKSNVLLNDVVWNYERDPNSWIEFKEEDIEKIKRVLEETNELLIKNGICFVYHPPKVAN